VSGATLTDVAGVATLTYDFIPVNGSVFADGFGETFNEREFDGLEDGWGLSA
jgi:hypothetical protein